MATPNYRFDKRQREIKKNQKQEEKRLKKIAKDAAESGEAPVAEENPDVTPPESTGEKS